MMRNDENGTWKTWKTNGTNGTYMEHIDTYSGSRYEIPTQQAFHLVEWPVVRLVSGRALHLATTQRRQRER
jgi:hypothetical protein